MERWLLASVLLFALASRADALTPAIGLRAVVSVQRSGPVVMAGQVKHHQKGRRSSRVAQVVQKELSTIIRSGTVHGPRVIQERLRHMISIVDVDVSPDLGNARVKVSIIGDQKDKISAIRWLQSSASPIRHVLAHEMKQMRRVPRLSFQHVDVGKAVEVMVGFGLASLRPSSASMPVLPTSQPHEAVACVAHLQLKGVAALAQHVLLPCIGSP